MPLSDCEPFKWYLVITCENCGHKQVLFRDLSNGTSRIRGTYKQQCEKCQHVGYYDDDQVERYQHIVERRKNPRP